MRTLQGRKALLLLTDGVDTASRTTLTEAIEHARRSDTAVYSILYSESGRAASPKGLYILNELALGTGGTCFTVTPDRTLEQILADIEAEWTAQYSIGFTPAVDASGEYRKLSLRTTGNRFVVHTRDSYFAR